MKTTQALCFLLIMLACIVWQCEGCNKLNYRVRKALKDDQGLSCNEFEEIRKFINNDADLKVTFPDDSSIVRYVDEVAQTMGRAGRRAIKYPATINTCATPSKEDPDKTTFDFYYENSASMDGYLNGKTEFIDATLGLMTRAKLQGAEINLHYINKEVFPVDSIIRTFNEYLVPATVRKFGNRGNSEINQILKIVAESAVKHPDHIAVVISDYIYSIQGRKVRDELDLQRHTTALSLAELPKNDFAVLIVKINSQFNGTFYDMLNQKVTLTGEKRPVYFWVIGKCDKIIDFPKQYRFDEFLTGYETHLVLLPEEKKDDCPYYTVLLKSFREGRFEKTERGANVVTSIENIEPSHKDAFQVAVAVDYSRCPAVDAYYSDPVNYEVTSDVGDEFNISAVHPIIDLDNNDRNQKGSATHILVLTAAGKISKGSQTLSLSLKKRKPAWVDESSTESDVTPEGRKGKTFGLQHLVEGAMESYGYNKESVYHAFPITIKN